MEAEIKINRYGAKKSHEYGMLADKGKVVFG